MSLDFLTIIVAGLAALLLVDLACFFWLRSHEMRPHARVHLMAARRHQQSPRFHR